ncbi:MAG: carboxypeptidase-like regulatory domain-containing protein [Blastocatellia bacterium]
MKLLFNHIFLSIVFVFSITLLLPVSIKAQPVPHYRSFNIVDIEGTPIANAKVEIFVKGEFAGSPKETLQTDEQGNIPNFFIEGLINNNYSYGNIKISKPGYISTTLILSDTNKEHISNILSDTDKKHIGNESNPMLFEDMAIFETRKNCPNCCNLLVHKEDLWNSTNQTKTKPKPIKIKLLLLPTTKTEWEMLAQEQKNRELISAIVT